MKTLAIIPRVLFTALLIQSSAAGQPEAAVSPGGVRQDLKSVKTGADILLEKNLGIIEGKRVGLVTNHSAVLSSGRHLADALNETKNVRLVALFGPEHGIRGNVPDGGSIQHSIDSSTGVPVYSLYGKSIKPTDDMLKNVDILMFDIQDIGARFYTFISTLLLAMESAAEHGIPFVVLDRPNPIRGTLVDGPIRLDSLKSFVGWPPIPVSHGMTVGELATMANNEGWLANGIKADLIVVRMEGWTRSLWYDETTLAWIKPSPNMPTMRTAVVYPGICFIEGTNVSEGRGSEKPFEYVGAPWIDGKKLAEKLNSYGLPGVRFEEIDFTPRDIPNVASHPKYKDRQCRGVYIDITDRNNFQPVKNGVALLVALHALFPDSFQIRDRRIDLLTGTPSIRLGVLDGKSVEEIAGLWKTDVENFTVRREKSLLYR